jgi:hypothetical protein
MGNLFTLCSGKRSEETEIINPQENYKDESNVRLNQKEFEQSPIIQTNELRMNRIHPIQTSYESNSKIDADIGRRFGF